MNYKDSIDYIDKLYIGKSKVPTLDRVKKTLDALSFDDDLKVVHVAGTNGKGSTCSMIASVLKQSGYKVGLYTSPHLVKINERIKINDIDISDDDFAKYITKVVEVIEKNNIELLFFEVLTVVAFLYFKDEKCDIVVLETGMGGEYDATNVIKNPICTVITNIGLDHEDILGVGIENISKAKAGIIKENVDCVVYDIKEGRKVFEDVALKKKAKIHFANFNNIFYEKCCENKNINNITNFMNNNSKDNFQKCFGRIENKNNINNVDDINNNIKEKTNNLLNICGICGERIDRDININIINNQYRKKDNNSAEIENESNFHINSNNINNLHNNSNSKSNKYGKMSNIHNDLCDFVDKKNTNNINNIYSKNSIIFNYKNYNNLSTSLIGEHQVYNACVAIETIDILREKGYVITESNIKNGLKSVNWPARFQILQENNPMVILDGGHNPQCIDAIVKELKKYKNADIVFVVSIVKDKNADLMARELSSVSKKFVLTHIDNKRGMEEKELEEIFLRYSDDVTYRYDIKESIEYAKKKIKNDGIVCIIGSLYFAGDLLKGISFH